MFGVVADVVHVVGVFNIVVFVFVDDDSNYESFRYVLHTLAEEV
jgi:hypothetical protein